MPLTASLLAASAVAGKKSLEKAVESIYSAATEKTKKIIKTIRNEKEIAKLYTQISKVRKVKTLGQLDKAVDLMTFYCPFQP